MIGIYGLARGPSDEFYAARFSHRDIYGVTPGGVESPYAGVHLGNACIDRPRLGGAKFSTPAGLTVAGQTLYIADSGCHSVRTIDLPGIVPAAGSSWGRLKTLYR